MDIREFKNTYWQYSPSIIWDWCAKPTAEEIDAKLFLFSKMGISRVYIRSSKGLVLPYLSPDYFELIRTAARRGGKYSIKIGICDENSSCSGNGGGEITSVPDYRLKDILTISGKDVEKFDEIISENADSCIVLRDMSRVRALGRMPVADITNLFVTESFAEAVYDKYKKECCRFIGTEIDEFMTEINLPENALFYSETAARGIQPTDIAGKNSEIKKCYDEAFSNCIEENYTSVLSRKCKSQNLSFSVCVDGNEAVSRQSQYAKADKIILKVDSEKPDLVQIMLAKSSSEQFEKPFFIRLLLPAFASGCERYNHSASMIAMGADGIIYDSVAFSFSDRRKYENHSVSLSQYTEKDISERLSRLSFVSSATDENTKLLVIYTAENKDEIKKVISDFLERGISFHMIEESFFKKHACISDKIITVGKCAYESVFTTCKNFAPPKDFKGKVYTPETLDSFVAEDLPFEPENPLTVNRRFSEGNEYLFITAKDKDTRITAFPAEKKLFVADFSNGEIYEPSFVTGNATFTLRAGKTALLICSDQINADIAPPFTDDIEFAPHTEEYDVPFALSSAEENILPLKNIHACFGKKSYRDSCVDDLHKEYYRLADGETVKVKYPFEADKNSIGNVTAYIENADNLEFAELNGKRLGGFSGSEKDPRFMGVDITDMISNGKNTLAIEYRKSNNYTPDFSSVAANHFYSYNVTSFEPIYLCGDFDCTPSSLLRCEEYSSDITKSGMAYYYGGLTYAAKLPEKELTGSVLAIHGSFDICKIRIGKRSYTFFCETPMIELFNLDSGIIAEVTIYNTPFNLFRTSDKEAKPFGIEKIELCKFEY